jgi:protein-S-isoprenylcysteine O-methyltransferase Ste14
MLAFLVRYRIAGGFLLALAYLWFARPTWRSTAAGLIVALPGMALRIWAAGHIRKGKELTVTGPYSLVRNPLYLGSFAVGLGLAVMGLNPWFAAGYVVLFALVYGRKMRDEETHLLRIYGAVYPPYRDSVPRIVPRFHRPDPGEGFSWAMVVGHREYELWLGIAAVTSVMIFKILRAS